MLEKEMTTTTESVSTKMYTPEQDQSTTIIIIATFLSLAILIILTTIPGICFYHKLKLHQKMKDPLRVKYSHSRNTNVMWKKLGSMYVTCQSIFMH